jgi:uncharacterized protein (TIGR02996 family)
LSEEDAFLDAIRKRPDDDVTRLVYADWLDEQGDKQDSLKSQYLRIDSRLASIAADTNEYTQVLESRRLLAKQLKKPWLAVVSKVPIENCDVQFEFECPKQWDQLRPTAKSHIRYCDACRQNVYYCKTIDTARNYATVGLCIAIDASVSRAEGDLEPRAPRMGRWALPRTYPPLEE